MKKITSSRGEPSGSNHNNYRQLEYLLLEFQLLPAAGQKWQEVCNKLFPTEFDFPGEYQISSKYWKLFLLLKLNFILESQE